LELSRTHPRRRAGAAAPPTSRTAEHAHFRRRGNACLQWQLCAVASAQVREPATRSKINASWEPGTLKLV
jgi:hypothetical protein